ncbi:MAG: type II toxin-antitoxin system HicB family antitoxin [Candidatus Korobacteraceae bacterium]
MGMEMVFTAIFEPVSEAEGGGYVAYAAELPEAISEGDDLDQARENLRSAIEMVVNSNRSIAEHGLEGKRVTREEIRVKVA